MSSNTKLPARLFSRALYEDIELGLEPLLEGQRGCNGATVVSCYTSLESLQRFWRLFERHATKLKKSFRIYLDYNALNPTLDPELAEGLKKLQRRIFKTCGDGSGIFLVRAGRLFHPKIYCFTWKSGAAKVFIGSANLSIAAFEQNEEFLYRMSPVESKRQAKWLEEYLQHLHALEPSVVIPADVAAGDTESRRSTMRELLLSGRLYFERDEHDRFRVGLHLPKEFRQLPSTFAFVKDLRGNSISIKDVLTGRPPEGLGFSDPLASGKGKITQPKWKQYAVQTCYGYWVPVEYLPHLKDALRNWLGERIGRCRKLVNLILDNRDDLTDRFNALLETFQKAIDGDGYAWERRKNAEQAWERKFNWLERNKNNVAFVARLASDIDDVKVPDVWNDPDSTVMLENSFISQLLYDHEKADLRRSNKIARAFSPLLAEMVHDEIDLDDDEEMQEACRSFEVQLGKHDLRMLLRKQLRIAKDTKRRD